MKTQRIPIDRIDVTSGTQCREDMSGEHIEDIKAAIESNATIPPVHVVYDSELDRYYLVDGFHRFFAHEGLDHTDIEAEVTQGTIRDAILLSCGVNSTHGLKRTNADKKRAVLKLLSDKEWGGNTNAWIAEKCCVTEGMVRKYRQSTTKDRKLRKNNRSVCNETAQNTGNTESAATDEAPRISGGITFNVDELEGQAAPEPAKPKHLDEIGRPVPDRLEKQFLGNAHLAAACKSLKTIRETVKAQAKARDGYLALAIERLENDLKALESHLKETRYWTSCPKCSGAGCMSCRDFGYWNLRWKRNLTDADRQLLIDNGGNL